MGWFNGLLHKTKKDPVVAVTAAQSRALQNVAMRHDLERKRKQNGLLTPFESRLVHELDAELLGDDDHARRLTRRHPTQLTVRCGATTATLVDVSMGGCLIELTERPPVGAHVDLELVLAGGRRWSMKGRVVRHTAAGVGLAFGDDDAAPLIAPPRSKRPSASSSSG